MSCAATRASSLAPTSRPFTVARALAPNPASAPAPWVVETVKRTVPSDMSSRSTTLSLS